MSNVVSHRGVFRLASNSLEERLSNIRTDIKELRDSVHFTATLAMCELMMTVAASSQSGGGSDDAAGGGPQTPAQPESQSRGSERAPSWTIEEVEADADWSFGAADPRTGRAVLPRSYTVQWEPGPPNASVLS